MRYYYKISFQHPTQSYIKSRSPTKIRKSQGKHLTLISSRVWLLKKKPSSSSPLHSPSLSLSITFSLYGIIKSQGNDRRHAPTSSLPPSTPNKKFFSERESWERKLNNEISYTGMKNGHVINLNFK